MNRHGLVAGATGTGKTKTLHRWPSNSSSRVSRSSSPTSRVTSRAWPAPAWRTTKITARSDIGEVDAHGIRGRVLLPSRGRARIPIRASVSMFGPTLLSKCLGFNDYPESSLGLLHYAFQGPGLDTIEDLRACHLLPHLRGGKADPRTSAGCRRRRLVSSCATGQLLRPGADAFSGCRSTTPPTAPPHRTGWAGTGVDARAARRADRPQLFLHLPHVAARGPLPRPARGR